MKRIMLLRHAKSSKDDPTIPDFDRPLNKRGLAAAPFMGKLIASRDMLPEAIVTSPARRALDTAMLFKDSSGFLPELLLDERIYDAEPPILCDIARKFSPELSCVMMVGHNPGFEEFLTSLTAVREPMPTSSVAVIDLDIEDWFELSDGRGKLIDLICPKAYM